MPISKTPEKGGITSDKTPRKTPPKTPEKGEQNLGTLEPLLPKGKSRRTIFVKPSIEEIKLQCAKIGLPEAEAEGFFYSHESKGWKIGNSPMVSWPAALQTWKRNHEKFGTRTNGFQKPPLASRPTGGNL
jgi:hypothetical protein